MKNFFPNKTALYALIAACFVVCASMGVRQTFGLYSSEFETTGGTSNTEFGLAIAVHAIFWGIFTPIFGRISDRLGGYVVIVPAAPAKPKPTNKPKLICNHIPETKLFPINSIDIE